MDKSNEIKALNTYYETANSEYDRIHSYFDQIDNKVGILIAVVVAVPIAVIGFASQLESSDFNRWSLGLGIIGILAFLGAGWNVLCALNTRKVKLGIPYDNFLQYCKDYDDKEMKEWVADKLMESSEFNYKEAKKKAEFLKRVVPFLIIEVLFFLATILVIVAIKL
jgi:hypothetical protein